MERSNILVFIFLILLIPSFGQNKKLNNAEAAYQAGEYDVAVDLFKDVYQELTDDEIKKEILFKISECYRITNRSRNAELWYRKAIRKEYSDPIVYYYYAEALRMNEEFDEALEQYQKYHELVPDDPKGEKGITSCNLAKKWRENPTNYQVEEMKFFNSRESDFSPVFASEDYNTVYFTSNRDEATGEEIHGATGYDFSDIFVSAKNRRGRWSDPEPINGEVNTLFEEGVCSVNGDYNALYFTRCQKEKKKKYGCQIYVAQKQGDSWEEPKPLKLADDSLVVAHPALSADGTSLYFVSDMPGGYGGKDIWMALKSTSGDFVDPVNLGGDINTDRDEMFPFVHSDGSLYFSSNGHIGLGGLDIYKAERQGSGWKVTNMRYPVNSTSDDFGIVFESEVERGYFSSNRDGLHGTDDIYSFYLPPLKFRITGGSLLDKKSEAPVGDARVQLIGSDGSNIETESRDDGSFTFMLRPNTDYVIISSKEGYLKGKDKLTTKGLNESKEFSSKIFMSPIDKPIDLPNIFYDLESAELRPESKDALNRLIEILDDNPKITIELSAHTDITGTREYNYNLSQERAQSVVDYLIEHDVDPERLTAKGYGPDKPKVIDMNMARQYDFLEEGDELTPEFIENFEDEEKIQQAHQINRRTEFRVLSTDYEANNN